MACRICSAETRTVVDLGAMPPANRLKDSPDAPEQDYPLVLEYCPDCRNLQLGYCVPESELYDSYFYVTPDSPSLAAHYDRLLGHMAREGYLSGAGSMVEFGSNAGSFLLAAKVRGSRVLGVDPAQNICAIARERGVETRCAYFDEAEGAAIRAERGAADVIAARHCAAHNRDPHLLLDGVEALLADDGVFVMENAYGVATVVEREFGQIYHEHMFYFTAQAVQRLFGLHGLRLIDIMMAPVHGGSIVFFAAREGSRHAVRSSVERVLSEEAAALTEESLAAFPADVAAIKEEVVGFVRGLAAEGRRIWLYGASAKASTFVNYLGLDASDVGYCADSTPIKQGRFMPKSNIAVRPEAEAIEAAPDYFLVTAWNYKDEIIAKVRAAGNDASRFIVPHPRLSVVP